MHMIRAGKDSLPTTTMHHSALAEEVLVVQVAPPPPHTPLTHCTVSASEGRSEVTAAVVYKSYAESRKALQKLEGKIFKGESNTSMLVIRLCGGRWMGW